MGTKPLVWINRYPNRFYNSLWLWINQLFVFTQFFKCLFRYPTSVLQYKRYVYFLLHRCLCRTRTHVTGAKSPRLNHSTKRQCSSGGETRTHVCPVYEAGLEPTPVTPLLFYICGAREIRTLGLCLAKAAL